MKTEVQARKIKLWMCNVEHIYKYVSHCVDNCQNRTEVVEHVTAYLVALYGERTPDDAPINKSSVRHALRNWPKQRL